MGFGASHSMFNDNHFVYVQGDPQDMADQEDSNDPHEDHGQVVLSPSTSLVIDSSLALTLASAILPQFDVLVYLKYSEDKTRAV